MKFSKLVLVLVSVIVFSLLLATPVLGQSGFVKNPDPVMQSDFTWDSQIIGSACVILDGITYKAWYTGYNGNVFSICYATSADGITWGNKTRVFWPSAAPAWDSFMVGAPWVVKVGATYHMYYTGSKADLIAQIGHATSADGINWTRQGANPVLFVGAVGSWDAGSVCFPSVIYDGGFKMWFTGRPGGALSLTGFQIGYATSADGHVWTKEPSNPRLTKGFSVTDFDGKGVLACGVYKEGASYLMYYTGFMDTAGGVQARIGEAFSTDGIAWTKLTHINPVLNVGGTTGNWDGKGVAAPCVFKVGDTYKMWYTGGDNSLVFKIGYAEYTPEEYPSVPGTSNLTTGLTIGSMAVLMGAVLWWGIRRNKYLSKD